MVERTFAEIFNKEPKPRQIPFVFIALAWATAPLWMAVYGFWLGLKMWRGK